jgi:hypothetical protein
MLPVPSERAKLKDMLERARADATQPIRISDTEFALIMLREAFVAAQASFTPSSFFSQRTWSWHRQ